MQHSIYDASGERVLKASSHYEQVYENGSLIDPNIVFDSYTTYPSAFMVIDPKGIYSKHYYAGTQRIVSRLGDKSADIFNTIANRTGTQKDDSEKVDETALRNVQVADLKAYLKDSKIGKVSFKEYKGSTYQEEEALLAEDVKDNSEEGDLEQERAPVSGPVYFYHPDHLGSSTFLTDANGNPYQFFINLPFGETMAEQLPDTYYRTPFKFNGKELDEETGLYYYGARYYDPKISIWLSVDPMAERGPEYSPYCYTFNNPINFTDPDGLWPWPIIIRSFAPWKNFGALSYIGDNRGYSLSKNVTSRISQSFVFNSDTGKVSNIETKSSSSAFSWLPSYEKTAQPRGNVNVSENINDKSYSIHSEYSGSLPIHPGFDIDVSTYFNITDDKKNNTLSIEIVQRGDKFPTAETIIYDTSGHGLFLGVASARGTSPELNVGGDNKILMMFQDIKVKYNEKGEFINVQTYDQKNYTRKEWNKKFETRSP